MPEQLFPSFHLVDHAVMKDALSYMRDAACPPFRFRERMGQIGLLLGSEVLKSLPTTHRAVITPLAAFNAPFLAGAAPTLVPVLRAGLGFSEAMLKLVPTATVAHIGAARDEETKEPHEYLVRLPKDDGQTYILLDPMLATGGTLLHACAVLNKAGIPDSRIRAMVLVAAPEGVTAFCTAHPEVQVYAAALDERLDEKAYIVPGLGDAGDRYFGT